MKKQEIIKTLKESYSRELRKQLVKRIQADEKENILPNYKIVNQIFSYILAELDWTIPQSTQKWDSIPLDIMEEVFPQIEKTNWHKEQLLIAKKNINIEIREE